MKIINSVVCYENYQEILNYGKAIESIIENVEFVLIITINKLENRNYFHLINGIKDIKINILIFKAEENLGYINGILYGLKQYTKIKQIQDDDLIIFSNTDISYVDKNFFKILISNFYNNDIGVIGPSIYISKFKIYENPVSMIRRSKFSIRLRIFIFSIPLIRDFYYNLSLSRRKFQKIKPKSTFAYEVHGCYFIVKPELTTILINNPFNYILYSEETYVSELARIYGYKVFYDSSLQIEHQEHSVTGKLKNRRIFYHIKKSLITILNDFYKC